MIYWALSACLAFSERRRCFHPLFLRGKWFFFSLRLCVCRAVLNAWGFGKGVSGRAAARWWVMMDRPIPVEVGVLGEKAGCRAGGVKSLSRCFFLLATGNDTTYYLLLTTFFFILSGI